MKDSDWEILYRLYKTPNITKVANMLYISQPSLTRRLKGIEEESNLKMIEIEESKFEIWNNELNNIYKVIKDIKEVI